METQPPAPAPIVIQITPEPVEPEPVEPEVLDEVPYPEAKAPWPMPAVAAAEDSDCSGLISLPPGHSEYPKRGTWAIGEMLSDSFIPIIFFNTRKDASDCVGSSEGQVMQYTKNGWKP
jgi:hypothetical protein